MKGLGIGQQLQWLTARLEGHQPLTPAALAALEQENRTMEQPAPYTPAKGDRVKIGNGKATWIIQDFPTLASGATVAVLTREGSNGYTNTTAEPARLKPAPNEAGK